MTHTSPRTVSASKIETIELVLPNDTNQLGNLLGGRLMHWIDVAAALAAMRHANRVCVTASVDSMNFHAPIKLGQMVVLKASVNRVFRTSMEVGVRVDVEDLRSGESFHAHTAYLTFVGVESDGTPVPAEPITPESDDELRRFQAAGIRREARLEHRARMEAMNRP